MGSELRSGIGQSLRLTALKFQRYLVALLDRATAGRQGAAA